MRIIDQSRKKDLPYDRVWLHVVSDRDTRWIYANIDRTDILMGEYSDDEEVLTIMDELAMSYINGEPYYLFPDKRPPLAKMSIESLDLAPRAYNALKRAGLDTVADIAKKEPDTLMDIRGMGLKCFSELQDKLMELGVWEG